MNEFEIIKVQFGTAIRKCRMEQKITQEKLAEMTELHRTYISEVERGERNVSLVNIYKISSALQVKLSKLFVMIESENE